MINKKSALFVLSLSILLSVWIFQTSETKLEKKLTSREWQSTINNYISPQRQKGAHNKIGILNKIDIKSNVKYLPNGTYLRNSHITMYGKINQLTSVMNISEKGEWELSGDYLLINPKEFKEISTNTNIDFRAEQLDLVKTLFIMDAEQSRRIDVINTKAILLTSLNYGSRILSSN